MRKPELREDLLPLRAYQELQELPRRCHLRTPRYHHAFLADRLMPTGRNQVGSPSLQQRGRGQHGVGITAIKNLQRLPHILAQHGFGADPLPHPCMLQRFDRSCSVRRQFRIR